VPAENPSLVRNVRQHQPIGWRSRFLEWIRSGTVTGPYGHARVSGAG